MEKWMVAHLDNGKNGLKFQIISILRFPSIFYQAWSLVVRQFWEDGPILSRSRLRYLVQSNSCKWTLFMSCIDVEEGTPSRLGRQLF
jgi:hypothetical protein